jgi:N4-(beta-N-acetylglucosaminyl)-L-asparaginase
MDRRKFVKISAVGSAAVVLDSCKNTNAQTIVSLTKTKPIVVSTWNPGLIANKEAWNILKNNGKSIDAVEFGVKIIESDVNNKSVGIGGLPDRNGIVTLDACIMDHKYNCGSVAFLQYIEHPISVARKVMEDTPHVMLCGKGALDFAIEKGFKKTNLLTPEAESDWRKWMATQNKKLPIINHENHDTIGMLAIDSEGDISGGCTTSGWAYKLHGRVGDSPIIGAGLYVDNEIGAACATGIGEAIIKITGSHLVVELMRQGLTPEDACFEAVQRIKKVYSNLKDMQVGFLAINKAGQHGGYSMYAGFNYALKDDNREELIDAKYEMEW